MSGYRPGSRHSVYANGVKVWRDDDFEFYRTLDGRYVAADRAGWIPGVWRSKRKARRAARRYLRGLSS